MGLVYHPKSFLFLSSSYSCRQNAYLKQYYNIVNLGKNLLRLIMKKIIAFICLILFTSANASGHLSDKDKKAALKCTGLYYANSMIPQGTLELDKIVFNIAAKKFLTSYLIKEGVKEDFINKELNKSVDELYGKPYDEKKTGDCNKYIYKLIPESKAEIDKLVKSGIY